MPGINWRECQAEIGVTGLTVSAGGGWRTQLPPGSRHRIVDKMLEMLKKHIPFAGEEGLQDLQETALRCEERIFIKATSQSDYLRKITSKMLGVEMRSQKLRLNPLQSNAASTSTNSQDPTSQSMHSQIQSHAQQLPTPMVSNIYRQHILSQNTRNNIQSTGVPNSTGLTHSMPPVGGMSQGTMSNVSVENPNMQNMSNVTPNAVLNSIWLDVPTNMYGNSQRRIPGVQQQVVSQDTQQHSQNPVVNSLQSNDVAASMEVGDWRSQLRPDIRTRVVNKIAETLKGHIPFSGLDEALEIERMAARFEEMTHSVATSQSDYLRKISLKILTIQTRSQNPIALLS
ncbi:mediator of RNA polymerase II transcription subunit 15a-like isoform X1 [Salvia splendens]|uniref:mediator of RNA polymerase II transcription subunit 15a-like isoform X1 n=1 Tax=Salvia splendens TaxID=180675 RepID=UPI001C2798D5|nr:mediator of RNA polymerase II transcription subunit 15a-like isoform X1 [Salvia splendens]XP_042059810.1 mediator of RNA polymerase II transcription subunit 15a-like isoform X1 [Salvia splendens]XP_042059811.1 mediator of RNA polymerase II transcription subunit 15a-like isoform X1 [Salvia splendens]XP_042059813.1 mediator of RNA polymerase II transcription subunit 15a-like isoform X1 [Salvia splendens]